MQKFLIFTFALSFLVFMGCEDSESPNSLGGDTDIELTEPGNEIGVSFDMKGPDSYLFNQISDSVFIKTREDGIITTWAHFSIDKETLLKIDTVFGTQNLDKGLKRQVLDLYLERFGATIDTSDKENMWLEVELKHKVTSKGIQDFVYSGGNTDKPFTIIKYNAKVGDKYTFKADDGTTVTREVTRKSSEDDYELGFIYIKVFETEEIMNDPMIDKITYFTNHKFGLVGFKVDLKNGNEGSLKLFPWDVLEF